MNHIKTELRIAMAFVLVAQFGWGLARADPILTFSYSDANGTFDSSTNTFTALSQAITDGDVTKLEGPATTATFDFDSASIGSALLDLSLNVSGITSTTASSTGTLLIQDVDGDRFSGNVAGDWVNVAGSAHLNGVLTNVLPVSSGDGVFEGTTGAFSMLFGSPTPYFGNIITLRFQGWFSDAIGDAADFSNRNTHVSGAVTAIPSPSAVTLGLIGVILVAVRRSHCPTTEKQ